MNISACVPARLSSTRLPGKLLLDLHGKSIIERVVEAAMKSNHFNSIYVLTDHESIREKIINYPVECIMTSPDCTSGTERIISVLDSIEGDIIINIQGDEPFVQEDHIDALVSLMNRSDVSIGTLAHLFNDPNDIFDYNKVKVVFNKSGKVLYFSRQAIPAIRDELYKNWHKYHNYYRHIGLYGYQKSALVQIADFKESNLEHAEKLEQLKWMDYGLEVHATVVETPPIGGIDTQEDYEKAIKHFSK